MAIRGGLLDAADGGEGEVLHGDEGLFSGVSSRAAGLCGLLVGGEIEGDEEHEVGGEDDETGDGSKFLARTLTGIWEPWPVGGGEVSVGSEIDEALNGMVSNDTGE